MSFLRYLGILFYVVVFVSIRIIYEVGVLSIHMDGVGYCFLWIGVSPPCGYWIKSSMTDCGGNGGWRRGRRVLCVACPRPVDTGSSPA